MKFSQQILRALKTHERIPDILLELLPDLHRNGSGYLCRVVWREDNHPSLRVFPKDGVWFWKDMGLNESGDVIGLVRRLTGTDFPGAVRWLADRLGISLPDEPQRTKPTEPVSSDRQVAGLIWLYNQAQTLDDGSTPAEYLRSRGLLDSARALGVRGYEPGEPAKLKGHGAVGGLSTIENWIYRGFGFLVYPGFIDGKTIAHRCRLLMSQSEAKKQDLSSAHWQPTTQSGLILPAVWPSLPEAIPEEIILTEGETDCLAVRSLVVGTDAYAVLGTGGLGMQTDEFKRLGKAKPKITLCFQRDSASEKRAKTIIQAFRRYGLNGKALVPAGGAKDWAELIEWGTSKAKSLDAIAAPMGDYSMGRNFDALDKHIADMVSGKIQPIPIPWPALILSFNGGGVPPGTIGLLSSRTGVGKTWFTYQWALRVSGFNLSEGLPVFICNSEMAEPSIAARLLALAAGEGKATSMSDFELVRELQFEHQAKIDKLPLEITPPDPRSVDDVIRLFTEKTGTHKLLIVDHIGDLSFVGKSWEALPRFTLQLRNLARRTKCVIMMVSHLKTGEFGTEVLAYSKAIENAVDWSWSLQGFESCPATVSTDCGNIEDTLNMTLTIRKNRFGKSGFNVGLYFDPETLAIRDRGRMVKFTGSQK